MSVEYTLRPAQPADLPFMQAVYASTRAAEMALVDWSAEQKQAFILMQFTAQAQHYARFYPEAVYSVILRGTDEIGRLIVFRGQQHILILDIALLPEHCGAGMGSAILRDLMAEAQQAGQPLRLHVETFNPALRLYLRLGFKKIAESGVYYEMEWNPQEEHTHER